MSNTYKKYAVFIDGDNISSSYFESIMTEISKEGEILVKRIYGDWTTSHMNSWKDKLFATPIRIFQQFRFGPNATDNSIIMDAIEISNQNKDIDAFCIVSKDSDYYSLALRLRENGKYVIGIGSEESKMLWQNSCNKFIKIENLNNIILTVDDNNKKFIDIDRDDIVVSNVKDIINFGFKNAQSDEAGWIRFDNFSNTIRLQYPSFDTRTYNHKNLLSLLSSFSHEIEIKNNNDMPPNYWLKQKSNESGNKIKGTIKRISASFGFIENDMGVFYFNNTNIVGEYDESKLQQSLVGSKVMFTVLKYPDPTKGDNIEKNGKASEVEILQKTHFA